MNEQPNPAVGAPNAGPVRGAGDLVWREMRVRAVRPDAREADFIFSSESVDSYGEIVEQDWRLDRFAKNPVALFSHNARELPIGRAKNVTVTSIGGQNVLFGTIQFATKDHNPLAEAVWLCVRDDFLRAVSVGFRPHAWRREEVNGSECLILYDNELMEISVVTVPANPDALVVSLQAAADKPGTDSAYRDALLSVIRELSPSRIAQPGTVKTHTFVAAGHDAVVAAFNDIGAAAKGATEPPAVERGDAHHNEDSEMDLKEMQAALSKAQDETAALRKERDEARSAQETAERNCAAEKSRADKAETTVKALEQQNDSLAKERDAATDRANKAEGTLLEKEIDALVSVKIDPSERDLMVDLAKSNRPLFDKLMAQRAPKTILQRDPAGMGPEPAPQPLDVTNENGAGFARLASAAAGR